MSALIIAVTILFDLKRVRIRIAHPFFPTWAATVAIAAPDTPHPAPKMRSGARTTLIALETTVVTRVVRVSLRPRKTP